MNDTLLSPYELIKKHEVKNVRYVEELEKLYFKALQRIDELEDLYEEEAN